MTEKRDVTAPPSFGHRRYIVASRRPGAMVSFGQPTTLEQAQTAARFRENEYPDARVGVFELRLVKP